MSGPILFLPDNCSPPWNVAGGKVPVQLCWYIMVRLMSLGQNFTASGVHLVPSLPTAAGQGAASRRVLVSSLR